MGLSLMTNVSALMTARVLNGNQTKLNQAMTRLTTGKRINSAMDDAAGLGISVGMTSEIRNLNQAARNAMDGLSMVQTAEGALGEISGMLIRMRELTVQSASDSISDKERGFLNVEMVDLRDEIDRVVNTTEFNGISLLKSGTLDIATETNGGGLALVLPDLSTANLGIDTASLDTKANSQAAMDPLDAALDAISLQRARLGSKGNILVRRHSMLGVQSENLSAARSRIMDADVAKEASSMARQMILMQAGVSMLAQANNMPNMMSMLLPR
ncbi:MAG: flagellin [Myxococcota bacterium]|jgi:flagellin